MHVQREEFQFSAKYRLAAQPTRVGQNLFVDPPENSTKHDCAQVSPS
jgi:hypothetical protein